jgi:hypothetical protein
VIDIDSPARERHVDRERGGRTDDAVDAELSRHRRAVDAQRIDVVVGRRDHAELGVADVRAGDPRSGEVDRAADVDRRRVVVATEVQRRRHETAHVALADHRIEHRERQVVEATRIPVHDAACFWRHVGDRRANYHRDRGRRR